MVVADIGPGETATRSVPIDWEALEDAFENNAPEVHSYLHVTTGEVLRVVDGIADPEMHARIASDPAYIRLEPVSSREQYRWMERFIPLVEDDPLRVLLMGAIDGKGAFRRFKDVLMAQTAERERWFTFRSERLRVFMEAWLEAHHISAVPRAVLPVETPAPEEAVTISQDQLAGRRGRSAEALRAQLRALAESLGGRDLEKVTAFAEFVKARRAARSYAQRHDGPADEGGDSDDEAPPTSSPATPTRQRRAAAQ